jgi:hypothetical protein
MSENVFLVINFTLHKKIKLTSLSWSDKRAILFESCSFFQHKI